MADINLCNIYKSIANVIREKTGISKKIPVIEFPERILSMTEDIFVSVATGKITNIEACDLNSITYIGDYAFAACNKLESVILPSSITSISSTAFFDCNNLKVINVPWAKNKVSNAPWGANNATINYNYGGE